MLMILKRIFAPMPQRKRIAIIGAGAAGCFCAANIMEMSDECNITIFEAGAKPMHKLSLTGGGRCNITNSFSEVASLADVYPRGHRLLKGLFYVFDHDSACSWFDSHGIRLYTQDDNRVFPVSDDAFEVVNTLLGILRGHGVRIITNTKINGITRHDDGTFSLDGATERFDRVVVTTGGMGKSQLMQSLGSLGHKIAEPVPSLFSFKVNDQDLTSLMGASVPMASVLINGTKLRAEGALLVTHFGFSGPAVLRLSSFAARTLAERNYSCDSAINWTGRAEQSMRDELGALAKRYAARNILSAHPENLTNRLWAHLVGRAGIAHERTFAELGKKNMNKLLTVLLSDNYHVSGRGQYKEEFVTCGGVELGSVSNKTLESKAVPGLFFAGELLDIDALTGGFNLQAAWTTAYTVASGITQP